MKVLMINSVCGIRSTGRICTDLADTLAANGHECKVAYGRESVPEKYSALAYRIGTETDVRMHGVKSRLFDASGWGSAAATKRFVKWIEKYDPDIIHLHNIHGYYINIEVLFEYLKTCGKKIVWTLHDCWPFTGHCSHFTYANCSKWKSGCEKCPLKKDYPGSLFFDRSKKNYALKKALFTGIERMTIVTPSHWLADLVGESFLGAYPVKVIHNGIDTSTFKPTKGSFRERYGLEDKKIILGVAVPWSKQKGLTDFLKLSEMLSDEYRIVLVGLSREQLKLLPENVIGLERTNSVQELVDLYSSADVFLNPTYEDTYPTTNLEAQACGTPAVTYRTGGSVESVPEGNVIDCGKIEQILPLMGKCAVNSEMDFSKEKFCQEYLKIYLEREDV